MSPTAPVYLDYAATTPVDPAVAALLRECLGLGGTFGNAASLHAYGQAARARVATAREQVAQLVGAAADEIVFTSGATEANNLAVLGCARARADHGRHVVTVRTEHKSVLDPCRRLEREGFRVSWLAPGADGALAPATVAAALRPETVLVTVMHANNETGVLQDIAALGALCRERGVALHTDAAQSAGKLGLDVAALGVDFLALTAHKLYGPKGVGALYVRRAARASLQPLIFGGGQEGGLRPGTLPVELIAAFGLACEIARRSLASEGPRLEALAARLWSGLEALSGTQLNGAAAARVPGLINVSFAGVEGESLRAALASVALSSGAACDSDTDEPSHVLRALGRSRQLAESSLRFSLGRFSTTADVDAALDAVRGALARLRALSPAAGLEGLQPPWTGGAGLEVVSGEGGAAGEPSWVRFQLLTAGDSVKDARVQAFGCPHTMQTAAWVCAALPGRQRAALIPGTPEEWQRARQVPVEKLGRLFAIEDALRACLASWQ
jgi:cysteine desulfurase